ncbi:MAG: hypothetical protein AB7O97_19935 [Planctomycetota bacterium]
MSHHRRRHLPGHLFAPALCAVILFACSSGGTESGGAGSSDTTPPLPGSVADGFGADVDTQTSTSVLSANWQGFTDDTGIAFYEAAVGTTAGGTEVLGWTPVGATTSVSAGGFALDVGTTYYIAIRAHDAAGNVSAPAFSDGVQVTGGGGGSPVTTARALSQWGITWTFAQERTVGQFANGDWWVLGPVDVIDIAPRTANVGGRQLHGSMVNPVPNGRHGYDSALYGGFAPERYDAALNVAIGVSAGSPLHLGTGSSLVSTISQQTPDTGGSLSELRTAAVLTVLAATPPANAFRPPYSGSDKTVRFTEAQLDYTRLAALSAPAGTPAMATVADQFARVWLDHCSGWVSRYMHPVLNMPDYSRDFTAVVGTGALMLNLDFTFAQKRDLLVRMVQLGIDNHGNVLGGATWPGTGGQCSGRKFPILFAGHLLHDPTMTAIGTSHRTVYLGPGNPQNRTVFGEDTQTFVVQETSPGVYNWNFGNYNATHVGMPEWGNSHAANPGNDNVAWGADSYRRCCTANAWLGQCLALRVMGLRTLWNHDPFFAYVDRYVVQEPSGWLHAWEPWHATMWAQYRPSF